MARGAACSDGFTAGYVHWPLNETPLIGHLRCPWSAQRLHIQRKTQNKKHLTSAPRPRRGPTSTEIADFARYRRDFFGKYIDLSNGLPTDNMLRRFFQNLDSNTFRARFAQWVSSIVHDGAQGKVVSIDYGKKRVSLKRRMLRAVHDQDYLESLLARL